eukprot:1193429-Amphidinium_carterae.1
MQDLLASPHFSFTLTKNIGIWPHTQAWILVLPSVLGAVQLQSLPMHHQHTNIAAEKQPQNTAKYFPTMQWYNSANACRHLNSLWQRAAMRNPVHLCTLRFFGGRTPAP